MYFGRKKKYFQTFCTLIVKNNYICTRKIDFITFASPH